MIIPVFVNYPLHLSSCLFGLLLLGLLVSLSPSYVREFGICSMLDFPLRVVIKYYLSYFLPPAFSLLPRV